MGCTIPRPASGKRFGHSQKFRISGQLGWVSKAENIKIILSMHRVLLETLFSFFHTKICKYWKIWKLGLHILWEKYWTNQKGNNHLAPLLPDVFLTILHFLFPNVCFLHTLRTATIPSCLSVPSFRFPSLLFPSLVSSLICHSFGQWLYSKNNVVLWKEFDFDYVCCSRGCGWLGSVFERTVC